MSLLDPPGGKPWALLVLCGASLVVNAVLLTERVIANRADAPDNAVVAVEPAADPVAVDEIALAEVQEVDAVAVPVAPAGGVLLAQGPIDQNLSRTFGNLVSAEQADVVSATYARLFFWDLDLRRDLQKGDHVALAYTWDGELAQIDAASYKSGKLGKTLHAYAFQATGDAFPSYWDEAGVEVPYQLVDSPIAGYEQVTSLLKDRPQHKGMDFKTPVGTDVVSPRAGTVVRTDWNWKFNGNCVEVQYTDGTLARFLHLSETAVAPGQKLAKGARIGATGNTGRSTAPHLHYELEKNGRALDPIEVHGVTRRELGADDLARFRGERKRMDRVLAGAGGA